MYSEVQQPVCTHCTQHSSTRCTRYYLTHKGQVQVRTVTLTNRGQTMATPSTRPVTRADKENSKKEFDSLMLLIQQEFRGLEGWLTKDANPKLTNLAKLITGDLKDADKRWECETEIRIITTLAKTGQIKVDFVESLIGKLNEQVLRAPIAESDTDDNTSEARLYKARELESHFEDNKEAFDRWVSWSLKIKANFKELTTVKKFKDEEDEDSEDRDRRRPRHEDKGSTTDAKALKLDILDTSMPQLSIKNWYRSWDNYMHASGWGQGENHKTQLAYLHMCVSNEIRTAINFDMGEDCA